MVDSIALERRRSANDFVLTLKNLFRKTLRALLTFVELLAALAVLGALAFSMLAPTLATVSAAAVAVAAATLAVMLADAERALNRAETPSEMDLAPSQGAARKAHVELQPTHLRILPDSAIKATTQLEDAPDPHPEISRSN
jgi:Tfp pilus assembly protein PilE